VQERNCLALDIQRAGAAGMLPACTRYRGHTKARACCVLALALCAWAVGKKNISFYMTSCFCAPELQHKSAVMVLPCRAHQPRPTVMTFLQEIKKSGLKVCHPKCLALDIVLCSWVQQLLLLGAAATSIGDHKFEETERKFLPKWGGW